MHLLQLFIGRVATDKLDQGLLGLGHAFVDANQILRQLTEDQRVCAECCPDCTDSSLISISSASMPLPKYSSNSRPMPRGWFRSKLIPDLRLRDVLKAVLED